MKQKTGLAAILLAMFGSNALAQVEGSRAYTFSENDNALIERQQGAHLGPMTPGTVKIEFFGHMSFKVTSPTGFTLLIDPWRNDPSGSWGSWFPRKFPEIPVDLVISTHAHFDHDAVERPHALMVFERPVGEYTFGDVKVTGLAEKHQCHSEGQQQWDHIADEFGITLCPPHNPLAFDNTLQIIETGGLRIGFWGDNRPMPAPALDSELMDLDVLILPIDATQHVLTYREVEAIIAKYKPKSVIPAHYLTKGVDSILSGLKSADGWVTRQKDVKRVVAGELSLSASELNGAKGRVYYFGDNFRQ